MNPSSDTICSIATAAGNGAIALIRLSGSESPGICRKVFFSDKLKNDAVPEPNRVYFGEVKDDQQEIDEVLVTFFTSPHSYTGEDVVEISCHGSQFIQQRILNLLIKHGARLANPGEFTLRAFLNRKLDLSQAEAVADLIASDTEAAHRIAISQLKGGFSDEIKKLRSELIHFASLLELELDFSEEDVEFANRTQLKKLIADLQLKISRLVESFHYGNAIRNGIQVVIAGKPNAGKSTLLNAIVNEERAIVSEIAGTTRDTVEEEFTMRGIKFRFIDTAGIRQTMDAIESTGVRKAFEKISTSAVVVYVVDPELSSPDDVRSEISEIKNKSHFSALIIPVINKTDRHNSDSLRTSYSSFENVLFISAKMNHNISAITEKVFELAVHSKANLSGTIVVNSRHIESLINTQQALDATLDGIEKHLSNDLLAVHVRQALYHLGLITGEISTGDLLGNIFSKFCIGK